jgi:Ca-activated chloride channel family protein
VDVYILLDVSRSMLARDLAPSRLERAKLAIRDDLLPALGGDRVGLIAFAGVPSLVCPLTSDYGFFRLALADVNPQTAPRGGTNIGDAIRKAAELFKSEKLDTHRIILIITDGEDQDSYPVQAAANAWQEQQATIIALGFGDPEQGTRIPVAGDKGEQFLEYKGEAVRSRADFATLEQVAHASERGVFVPVGTSNFDLGRIHNSVVGGIRATEQQDERRVTQPSRMHVFAVAALALVLLDSLLRDAPRAPGASVARTSLEKAA